MGAIKRHWVPRVLLQKRCSGCRPEVLLGEATANFGSCEKLLISMLSTALAAYLYVPAADVVGVSMHIRHTSFRAYTRFDHTVALRNGIVAYDRVYTYRTDHRPLERCFHRELQRYILNLTDPRTQTQTLQSPGPEILEPCTQNKLLKSPIPQTLSPSWTWSLESLPFQGSLL